LLTVVRVFYYSNVKEQGSPVGLF